jgi:hypothetical protein
VGIYVLDLRTGQVQRLTDYKEPRALIDGDTLIVVEPCVQIEDLDALSLE